jgi:hypothetical protein
MKFSLRLGSILLVLGTAIFLVACSKSATSGIPSVTTNKVTNITSSSASTGGDVTADGGDPVTARGICIGLTTLPTITGSKTVNGTGLGTFTSTLTGLKSEATYYVRAYATNKLGTAYGNQETFIVLVP